MIKFTIPGEPKEEWKDIKGFEGIYQISNQGNIRSLDTIQKRSNGKTECLFSIKGQLLKPFQTGKTAKNNDGYLTVSLCNKNYKVHRLVAETFILNPDNLLQVNHKDGNKRNNSVLNLEWCTNKNNAIHAADTGLTPSGSKNINHKLTEKQVKEIREKHIQGDKIYGAKPLAKLYGVSDVTIRNIISGKKWRNV